MATKKSGRRDTDWWCTKCRRPLHNNHQHRDTVRPIIRPETVAFIHVQCGGPVDAGP